MARIALNAKKVASLKPEPVRVDYFDTNLPGFFIRVTPAGVKTFGVMYRIGRQKRRYTIGKTDHWTLADARKEARDALRAASRGEDPALAKKLRRDAETFGELVDRYLEEHASTRRSGAESERILRKYFAALRHQPANDVTRLQVRTILRGVARTAPIMANRCLAAVRKLYNWALTEELVSANPCANIPAPSAERRRDRVLSEDEIRSIWKALEAETSAVADVYKLRLLTAQRGGEVLGMRWDEIEDRWWTIPAERSKNKLPHRVWLSDPVMRILERARKRERERERVRAKRQHRPARPLQFVFPGRREGQPLVETKLIIGRIRESSKVSGWTGHDLRRTAASLMTGMGVPRFTVRRLLNHAEPEVTATYDLYSYDAEKRDALDRWASKLMVIVSGLREVESSAGEK